MSAHDTPEVGSGETAGRDALREKRCVFCPIIDGDAPAKMIERAEHHIAFVPMGPHVPGHVLFVPTEHLPDATTNPVRASVVFAEAARYVAEQGIEANIITSIGPAATQSVPHLHVHVIPRGSADGLPTRWPWIPASPDPVQPADAGEGLGEAERIVAGRIRHGVGSSEDFPGNVCHLVSPIVGWMRLKERDGKPLDDLEHTIDRLSLVLDMARAEAARAESAEAALATALREKAEDRARVEAVREWAEAYQGQWNEGMAKARLFTFDGGVGAAAQDVLAALAIPTTTGDE